MKKVFLFLALATMLLSTTELQAQIGFHVGYAPQWHKTTNKVTDSLSTHLLHGFYAGVHYTFGIVENLDIVTSLQVRMNSATVKESIISTQYWQLAAEIPVFFNYGFPVHKDMKVGIMAGPMLSVGINYTEKKTNVEDSEIIDTNDFYGSNERKRVELEAAIGVNFQYKTYMIFGGYSFGLYNLDKRDDYVSKIGGFFVGIAFH